MPDVVALYIKRAHGGVMDRVQSAELRAESGIVGNADQGGRRQVTMLEHEVWERLMTQLGTDAPISTRRANVIVREFPLRDSRGRTLRIGNCRLRIRGEVKPCEHMEDAVPGLQDAMFPEWRGGAFAEIIDSGTIRVGDTIAWADDEERRAGNGKETR